MTKEEYAIVLEYLPNGYPLEKKMMPIVQAIGKNNLTLLELVPRRGINLNIGQEVYIGEGKRPEIYYIFGRLKREKLTESAKAQLEEFVKKIVGEREKEFVEFYYKNGSKETAIEYGLTPKMVGQKIWYLMNTTPELKRLKK